MIKNEPKVRFAGFSGTWETDHLENIVIDIGTGKSKYSIQSKSLKAPYEILGSTSIIGYDNTFDYDGNFILTARVGANAGTLYPFSGKVKITDNTVFIQSENLDFIYYLLTNFDLKKLSFGTGQPLIKSSELKKLKVNKPVMLKEQKKIGTFFKQLDDTIALQQQLVEQQQQYKKAMLQKMFPQKGERVPKVRFAGFSADWEIRKFNDFISKAGKKNTSGKDFISYSVSNKLGLVRQDQQFEGSRLDDLDKKAYKLVNPNEFAYNPARINVGSIAFNNLGNTVIVSSLYVVLKMSDKINNEYILQFIKSLNFTNEVKRNTEGSVREYLFYENFKNIKFPYTSNYKEQQKIGSFFKQLDDTIALHQKKLEDYQQLKKGLLKRMFV